MFSVNFLFYNKYQLERYIEACVQAMLGLGDVLIDVGGVRFPVCD
jgi:hypothetical protein